MAILLVIDDDRSLLRAMRLGLKASGHDVHVAADGQSGLAQVAMIGPDLVILDIGLPDIDGLDVCRRIRQFSDVPIIVLSATGSDTFKVRALDGGADDYVTKPFSMPELEARIRVALRHRGNEEPTAPSTLAVGSVALDLVRREARRGDTRLALTAKEFDVLAYLVRHVGKTCTHQMILRAVWGPGYGTEAQYVHAYMHRLRAKLGDEAGEVLQSIAGVGYLYAAPGAPDSAELGER